MELTRYENIFLNILKRKLFLSNIKIKTKVSINDLCKERSELNFIFGKDQNLIEDIIIDFVLYRKDKVIAGIEIVDEHDEFNMDKGKNLLINTLFKSMGYEYFRILDLNKLDEAAEIIVKKIK